MNSSPDWLPDGWISEVRAQKSGIHIGRQIKSYYDPFTESRFYSKKAVFRHLEAQKTCSHKTKLARAVDGNSIKEAQIPIALEEKMKTESINNENAPDGLPHGWIKEYKLRKTSRAKKDALYIDPVSGYIFRSLKDAFRYLETGDIHRCAIRPQKRCCSDMCALNQEFHSSTAAKRCDFYRLATKSCRVLDEKPDKLLNISREMVESPTHTPCNDDTFHTGKKTVELSSKNHRQTKNSEQEHWSHPKKTRAITMPVRASKRLAALKANFETTTKAVEAISGATIECSDEVKAESAMILDHGVGPAEKFNHPESSTMALESSDKLKKSKVTKGFTAPVRASKRLAALRADSSTRSGAIETLPGASIEHSNKLKAESNKVLDLGSKPTKKYDHQDSSTMVLELSKKSKNKKVNEASILPVQESKQLAAHGVNSLTASATVKVLPIKITHSDKLKAESNKPWDLGAGPAEKFDHQDSSTMVSEPSKRPRRSKVIETSTVSIQAPRGLAIHRADTVTAATLEMLPAAIIEYSDKLTVESAEVLDHGSGPPGKFDNQKSSTIVLEPSQVLQKSNAANASPVSVQASERLSDLGADYFTTSATAEVLPGAVIERTNAPIEEAAEGLELGAGSTGNFDHPKDSSTTTTKTFETLDCQKPDDNLLMNIQFENVSTNKEESGFLSPFGDSWPDPCIEFAFKMLTSDIPVLDETLTINDYFQRQLDSDISPDLGASLGSTKLENMNEDKRLSQIDPWNQHLFTSKDVGRPSSLGHGMPTNKFN